MEGIINLSLPLIDFPGKILTEYFIVVPEYFANNYRRKAKALNDSKEKEQKQKAKDIDISFATFGPETPFHSTNKISKFINEITEIYKQYLKSIFALIKCMNSNKGITFYPQHLTLE